MDEVAVMKIGAKLCDRHEEKFQVEWAEDRPSGRVKVNMCIACNYENLSGGLLRAMLNTVKNYASRTTSAD